jgi:hypothetical protein
MEVHMKNSADNERSKQEAQYLLAIPGMKEKLIEGSKTPIEECEDVDDINWEEIEKETGNQDNHT